MSNIGLIALIVIAVLFIFFLLGVINLDPIFEYASPFNGRD